MGRGGGSLGVTRLVGADHGAHCRLDHDLVYRAYRVKGIAMLGTIITVLIIIILIIVILQIV